MKPIKDSSVETTVMNHLTEANLRRHETSISENTYFEESLIRQEQAQLYEQALYECFSEGQPRDGRNEDLLAGYAGEASSQRASNDALIGINLYKHDRPSTVTPMQRFCTISSVNEPLPLYAKLAMQQMRVGVGSLDTVQVRSNAVQTVVAADLEVDEAIDLGHDVPPRQFGCEERANVRTRRPPVMAKKRKTSCEDKIGRQDEETQKPA